jgi:pimeloyl-ACP methyl ester carboxylesterase
MRLGLTHGEAAALLIHGTGASGGSWSPMVPALARHHHVIRVDLAGQGRSRPAASYDVPTQAAGVAAVLDHLGLRRVAVAGHSSGGWTATALGRRLDGHPAVDREVAHIWRRTRTSRGRVPVDRLADEVGWSRKRLWSRFRSQLGISPKGAARLVRFDHAAHLLAAAGVAAVSGYADQSHLHREGRAIAGLTPTAVAPWVAIDDVRGPLAEPRRTAALLRQVRL